MIDLSITNPGKTRYLTSNQKKMVITKDALVNMASTMPEKIDVEEVFDRILVLAKIEQAITESEQGSGQE